MQRFDRYVLSQLLTLFGFFALVLVLIYWINRAVVLFERLISDGQGFAVFVEFTILSLPSVVAISVQLSTFAAAVYVTNRLTTDSELVVAQATGISAWRLARPVVVFGLFTAIMMSVLTIYLVPLSLKQLSQREAEIATDFTAGLLAEGQFHEPTRGVTFYIREVTDEGELRDIFLADSRSETESVTYTAARAFLVRTNEGPRLVMVDGMAQTLRFDGQRLFLTTFDEFAYDIGALIPAARPRAPDLDELPSSALFFPTEELIALVDKPLARITQTAHDRVAQATLCLVAALIGFSSLVAGAFSRFGIWRQIVVAIFLLVVVKGLESVSNNAAQTDASLWPLIYVPTLAGIAISLVMIHLASRPRVLKRRRAAPVPA